MFTIFLGAFTYGRYFLSTFGVFTCSDFRLFDHTQNIKKHQKIHEIAAVFSLNTNVCFIKIRTTPKSIFINIFG